MERPVLESMIRNCEDRLQVLKESMDSTGRLGGEEISELVSLIDTVKSLRETAIKQMLIQGMLGRDIAVKMACSPGYVSQIRSKLKEAGVL